MKFTISLFSFLLASTEARLSRKTTSQNSKVLCGRHEANICQNCPWGWNQHTHSWVWYGSGYCNGDCAWINESCIPKSNVYNAPPANNMFDANAPDKCSSHTFTPDERQLHALIINYRREQGLSDWNIPLSNSLSCVAELHSKDLYKGEGHLRRGKSCNVLDGGLSHSWSTCCTKPGLNYDCSAKKPIENTDYPGDGYEVSSGVKGGTVDIIAVLEGWKNSRDHRITILNRGMYANSAWQAIGVGIYGGFANVWFGAEVDPWN